jgi:hypothetical protein
MTDARSPIRALRAALFAAVCTALAAMGHSSLSGHDLPGLVLVVAFLVSAAVAWLAGTRRRGALSIGTGLLTAQGALHLLFSGSDTHTASPGAGHAAMASAAMDGNPAGADHTAAETMAGLTAVPTHSAAMLAVHVAGAAVCALWLAGGEKALFRLARTIGALAFAPLRLLRAVVRVPQLPPIARPRPRVRRLHGVVLAHALSLRGPPAVLFPHVTVLGAHI